MAKLPSIIKSLRDDFDGTVDKLTPTQLSQLLTDIRAAVRGVVPQRPELLDSPAACGLALSRGEWQLAPHLSYLNDAVVDLINGHLQTEHGEVADILVVSMPPRHGKSQHCSWWTPTWYLAKRPKHQIILTSSEFTFAEKWGRHVRDTVLEHGDALGIRLRKDATAASEWLLESGGGMKTAGAGSSIIGRGANLFVIDDPHATPQEARSIELQEKMWDWFETVAKTRLEPKGKMILIGTRWHETDLIGRVVRDGHDGKLRVYELKLPALAESDDPLGREVDEALWPARYDQRYFFDLRNADSGYNFTSVYQQRPSPEEGAEVLRSWWKRYTVPPAQFDEIIQSWDFTFKKAKKSDYVVGQVWGRVGARFYLLYQVRARMGMVESLSAFRNTTQLYKASGVKLIEDKANGPAIADILRHEITGIVTWPSKGTKQSSKEERVAAVSPAIQSGNVYLPMDSWVTGYIEEFAAFPNGANDDQVDATTQALIFLRAAGWHSVEKDWNQALKGAPPTSTQEIFTMQMQKVIAKNLQDGVKRLQQGQLPHQPIRRVKAW